MFPLINLFRNLTIISKSNYQSTARKIIAPNLANIAINKVEKCFSNTSTPYEIVSSKDQQYELTKNDICKEINNKISRNQQGRLFAIVHVTGKQFKVTKGDVIIIEGYWPPDVGDKLVLDKVLLVGAVDFTLIGRPLVEKSLVKVQATVIEKTLSHTKTHFRKKRRKQYKRIHFYRIPQTMLRINSIDIVGEVNNPAEVRGLDSAIFT